MVQLEDAGIILTVIMLAAGTLMTAIATDPTMDNSTLTKNMETMATTQSDVNALVIQFNADFDTFASSSIWGQIPLGALLLIDVGKLILTYTVSALTNWTSLFDLIFGWNTTLASIGGMLKIIVGFVMIYTIYKFIAGLIKSLPFFGGG